MSMSKNGKEQKQPKTTLTIRLTDHQYQPINDAEVTLESGAGRKRLKPFDGKGGYRETDISPGEYHITVEAQGFAGDDRQVQVHPGRNDQPFLLGKEGMPFYYREKVKVPFEPMWNLVALVMPEPSGPEEMERQVSMVRRIADELRLEVSETGINITRNGIHVLRIPGTVSPERQREVIEALRRNPEVTEAGPLLKLFKENASILINELVIRLRKGAGDDHLRRLAQAYGFEVQQRFTALGNVYRVALKLPPSYEILELCNRLAQEEVVEYAEPNLIHTVEEDAITPADFLFPEQWDHRLIRTPDAWQVLHDINADRTFGNPGIVIAVVDSGVDAQHPEFNGTLSNGAAKIYQLFDFSQMVANNNTLTSNHGTCCASAVTALANNASAVAGVSEGVCGVAGNCRLIGIRRGGNEARYAEMYLWAAGLDAGSTTANFPAQINPGADIITNSFGFSVGSPISGLMSDTFDTLTDDGRGGSGVLLFFSAGNANSDLDITFARPWGMYERCFSVSASTLDQDGTSEIKAAYSSFGSVVEFCAPSNSDWAPVVHDPPGEWAAFTATIRNDTASNIDPTVGRPTNQTTMLAQAAAGATVLNVASVAGMAAGQAVLVGTPGDAGTESHRISSINATTNRITLNRGLFNTHPAGTAVFSAQRDYRSNFGGTSHATPLAAGVAALILTLTPGLGWAEVRDIMRDTAVKIDPGNTNATGRWRDADGRISTDPGYTGPSFSEFYGYGRLDAEAALRSILSGCSAAIAELLRRILQRNR